MADTNSTILVLHRRYETAWLEYARIEAERKELHLDNPNPERRLHLNDLEVASDQVMSEALLLKLAILYQVPGTWEEAFVLLYHALSIINSADEDQDERKAIHIALTSLFDFMACEPPGSNMDHEAMGAQFKEATMRAYTARRERAGVFE